jgi:hypothetical protein
VSGENLQPDTAFGVVMDDVDQAAQVPAQPVQFPDDQGVFKTQGFEAGG